MSVEIESHCFNQLYRCRFSTFSRRPNEPETIWRFTKAPPSFCLHTYCKEAPNKTFSFYTTLKEAPTTIPTMTNHPMARYAHTMKSSTISFRRTPTTASSPQPTPPSANSTSARTNHSSHSRTSSRIQGRHIRQNIPLWTCLQSSREDPPLLARPI